MIDRPSAFFFQKMLVPLTRENGATYGSQCAHIKIPFPCIVMLLKLRSPYTALMYHAFAMHSSQIA
jgi:hypothetical protein